MPSVSLTQLFQVAASTSQLLRSEAVAQRQKKLRTATPPGKFLRINKVCRVGFVMQAELNVIRH